MYLEGEKEEEDEEEKKKRRKRYEVREIEPGCFVIQVLQQC